MSRLNEVRDDDFVAEVLASDKPVIVDFTAAWCPPCRVLEPLLAQVAEVYHRELKFVSLDADTNPTTVAHYGVRSLPTLVCFRDGRELGRSVGALPRHALEGRITAWMEDDG